MSFRESLRKVFKPNPGELRQLDMLRFKLKLLHSRLRPKPFLEVPRHEWWNSVPSFSNELLGPLYLAFMQWPIQAFKGGEGDQAEKLFEFYNHDSRMTNVGATERLKFALRADTELEVYKKLIDRFTVEIEDVPPINNTDEVSDAITTWTALMNEHTWKDVIPGQPKIAILDKPLNAHLLPLKVRVVDRERKSEITFHRLFNRFYIPDFYRSEKKAKALFDYLVTSGQIAEISDYEHKEQVTSLLIKEIRNSVTKGHSVSVLDAGCGDGFVGEVMERDGLRRYVSLNGIDISSQMLSRLQAKGTYDKIAQLSISSVSKRKLLRTFSSRAFDQVVLAFVDFYLSDREKVKAYSTICQSLVEGGTLSFDVHHPDTTWKTSYANMLKTAGFSRVEFSENMIKVKGGDRKVGVVFAFK